ncbi:MAG: hypothetical protein D6805_10405 [Planctomycetota bacterium]|nr:MAG: hypothetical protein D6805_10405 [Planctomycetota bacterium]
MKILALLGLLLFPIQEKNLNVEKLYTQAMMLENSKHQPQKAMQLYQQILKETTAPLALRQKAHFRLGICLRKLGRKKEAMLVFRKISTNSDYSPTIRRKARVEAILLMLDLADVVDIRMLEKLKKWRPQTLKVKPIVEKVWRLFQERKISPPPALEELKKLSQKAKEILQKLQKQKIPAKELEQKLQILRKQLENVRTQLKSRLKANSTPLKKITQQIQELKALKSILQQLQQLSQNKNWKKQWQKFQQLLHKQIERKELPQKLREVYLLLEKKLQQWSQQSIPNLKQFQPFLQFQRQLLKRFQNLYKKAQKNTKLQKETEQLFKQLKAIQKDFEQLFGPKRPRK